MGITEKFRNICVSLGKNNKPTYAVMAIALVKGIARPTFTMMDKHEEPETKKYTALREGLTEVVAIPTYWACGEMASKIADKMQVTTEKKALAKHNFMFIGVCTAALFVIPALASVAIQPFMKKIMGDKKPPKPETSEHKLDIKETEVDEKPVSIHDPHEYTKPFHPVSMQHFNTAQIGGVRVGASW